MTVHLEAQDAVSRAQPQLSWCLALAPEAWACLCLLCKPGAWECGGVEGVGLRKAEWKQVSDENKMPKNMLEFECNLSRSL